MSMHDTVAVYLLLSNGIIHFLRSLTIHTILTQTCRGDSQRVYVHDTRPQEPMYNLTELMN